MPVVSNTSPLFNLAAIGQLHLLHEQFGEVLVPDAVLDELLPIRDRQGWEAIRQALDEGWISSKAVQEEIRKILDTGFTAEEIAAAKQGWLQQREVSRSQERELAAQLASLEHLDRTLEWQAELEATIEALRPEEILEALRRHLDLEKMSIVQAGDFARVAPDTEGKNP